MKLLVYACLPFCLVLVAVAGTFAGKQESVRNVKAVPASERTALFSSNRTPLMPSPLVRRRFAGRVEQL